MTGATPWTEADLATCKGDFGGAWCFTHERRYKECLEATLAAVRRELFDIEMREASTCDLLNSWAREEGVAQADGPDACKAVADRLWAHTSRRVAALTQEQEHLDCEVVRLTNLLNNEIALKNQQRTRAEAATQDADEARAGYQGARRDLEVAEAQVAQLREALTEFVAAFDAEMEADEYRWDKRLDAAIAGARAALVEVSHGP